MMTKLTNFLFLMTVATLAVSGCITERYVDQIIAEHGVTWVEESSGETTATSTTRSSDESSSSGPASSSSTESGVSDGASSTSSSSDSGEVSTVEATVSIDLPHEAMCGDGLVEGEETCDDQNDIPDDGCRECAKDSIVFASSQHYEGGEIGGLFKADQRCRGMAANAGLPRFETYMAWLSSQTVAAKDRLRHSKGRYVLVNGLVVANDWDELTSGKLQHRIDVDENSQTNLAGVYTGTLPDGSIAVGSTQCNDWTDNSQEAGFGASDYADAWWSFAGQDGCGGGAAIYCMEQ